MTSNVITDLCSLDFGLKPTDWSTQNTEVSMHHSHSLVIWYVSFLSKDTEQKYGNKKSIPSCKACSVNYYFGVAPIFKFLEYISSSG